MKIRYRITKSEWPLRRSCWWVFKTYNGYAIKATNWTTWEEAIEWTVEQIETNPVTR